MNDDPDYTNTPVSHWTITGDVEITYLQSLSGIGDSSPVEGTAYQAKTGEPTRPRWWSKATIYQDITLQRVLDTDDTLRQWRQEVKDGQEDGQEGHDDHRSGRRGQRRPHLERRRRLAVLLPGSGHGVGVGCPVVRDDHDHPRRLLPSVRRRHGEQ